MTEKVTKKKTTRRRRSTKSDDKADAVMNEVKEILDDKVEGIVENSPIVDEDPVISEEKKKIVEDNFAPVSVEIKADKEEAKKRMDQMKAELKESLFSESITKEDVADEVVDSPHRVEASKVDVTPNYKREGMNIGGMGTTKQPVKAKKQKQKPSRFTQPVYEDRDGIGSVQQTTFSQGK